jgi:hypothetical protein
MKTLFNSKVTSFLAAGLLAFSLNACDMNQVQPEPQVDLGESATTSNTMGMRALNQTQEYEVHLMPLNNSGVSGMATIRVEKDKVTVSLDATGLEKNQLHIQHIHGFIDNNKKAKCPGMEADTNGDGLIDLAEGLPFYGPVLLDLAPFSNAPDGIIKYMQTLDMTTNLKPMQNNVVVVHGLTVNGEYNVTLPVACGEIRVKPGSNKNR